MEFKIERTSIWDNTKPCKEAYLKKNVPVYDRRACSVEYYDKFISLRDGSKWFDRGTDHISEQNYIQRTVGITDEWVVEINSLAELMKFIERYGDIVLGKDSIEIYDTFREN